jgi:hypothetical protein
MNYQKQRKFLLRQSSVTIAALLLGVLSVATSGIYSQVLAEQIQQSRDLRVGFAIDPDTPPTSGKKSNALFVLARLSNYQFIELEQCNCRLEIYRVYSEGSVAPPNTQPSLTPSLQGVNVANHNFPGASITFPDSGNYDLRLTGTAKNPGDFQDFTLDFSVTVAP